MNRRMLTSGLAVTLMLTPAARSGADTALYEELANASYRGIEDQAVTLQNGHWEGKPYAEGGAARPTVGLADDFVLSGDFDRDGLDEHAVLLWQSSGGSGTFDHIAVLKRTDGRLVNIAMAPLGDRVQVRSGRVTHGGLELQVIQQGEGDAACCPSQRAVRSWQLIDGVLNEQEPVLTGRLDASALSGSRWQLAKGSAGLPLAPGPAVELSFSEARMSGFSGCNRFSADLQDGEFPGALQVGPVAETRKACPEPLMSLEAGFLERLGHVQRFGFQAGKLVLGGQTESGHFSLHFASLED